MTTRDAKKRDKHARIRAAAAALFRAHGFEGTTTRAIAQRARIATGTLFLYVRDKDDALALVFHDEVTAMLAARRAAIPTRAGLARRLAHLGEGFLALYGQDPALALQFVRAIPASDGPRKAAHDAVNAAIVAAIDAELARAHARGELRAGTDLAIARGNVFAVLRVRIFEWLARPPCDVAAGAATLRAAFAQLIDGLGAR